MTTMNYTKENTMNISENHNIETKVEKISQSLVRFDARLRGLEAQYKSASALTNTHTSSPVLFQKNWEE